MNKNIEWKTFGSQLPQLGMSIDRFKFRVWNKDKNKFSNFIKNELRFGCEGILTMPLTKASVYIIQQCTGLKDKNSKLIFEGDILKIKISSDYMNQGSYFCFVKFDFGRFCLSEKSNFREQCIGGKLSFYPSIKDGEIVGNIFENFELLK